jgi:hypothetical protein
MSTLEVSNITDGTTTVGTSYVVNGSAKAWTNAQQSGTQSHRLSLNFSSITDETIAQHMAFVMAVVKMILVWSSALLRQDTILQHLKEYIVGSMAQQGVLLV